MKVFIANKDYKEKLQSRKTPNDYIIVDLSTNNFLYFKNKVEVERFSYIGEIPEFPNHVNKHFFNISDKFKTKFIALKHLILEQIPLTSELSIDLRKEFDEEECVVYKKGNRYSFLFYRVKGAKYEFYEEVVNNKGLTPTQPGYKDFVYFIYQNGTPKAYKIGRTEDPHKRLKGVITNNPSDVDIKLVLPDGRLEKMYHEKFKHFRLNPVNEWFTDCREIESFIAKEQKTIKKVLKAYDKQLATLAK